LPGGEGGGGGTGGGGAGKSEREINVMVMHGCGSDCHTGTSRRLGSKSDQCAPLKVLVRETFLLFASFRCLMNPPVNAYTICRSGVIRQCFDGLDPSVNAYV
jgi:hypothetical protein